MSEKKIERKKRICLIKEIVNSYDELFISVN